MTLDVLIESIPAYAKDLNLNFSSVVRQQTDLSEQQAWGTVAAMAMASRNQRLSAAALEEAATHLSPEALDAAKAAAAIMGMNKRLLPVPAPHLEREVPHHAGGPAHERHADSRYRSARLRAVVHGGVRYQQLRCLRGLARKVAARERHERGKNPSGGAHRCGGECDCRGAGCAIVRLRETRGFLRTLGKQCTGCMISAVS